MAAALIGLFVHRERRSVAPMINLRIFLNPRFSAASAAVTVVFFTLFGFIFVITQYFQFIRGYSALSTGVRLLPFAVWSPPDPSSAPASPSDSAPNKSSPPDCCSSARSMPGTPSPPLSCPTRSSACRWSSAESAWA